MKEFFKFMFASMLGFILTSILLFFLFFAFVMTLISFAQPDVVEIEEPSVLHLKFDYEISDRASPLPDPFTFNFSSFRERPGLREILKNLDKAKKDDRIKGIFLYLNDVPSGLATINEIRSALLDFKQSGKFIYAYGNIYFQKAYYLATVADKIFLNPEGFSEWKGLRGDVIFIKGMLDKLEIEPQIIRQGKFKSAVEPLIREDMSEENKIQTKAYINSMWQYTAGEVSDSRGISMERINEYADSLLALNPENAVKARVIDSLIYYDELLSILASEINVDNIKNEHLVSMAKYNDAPLPGKIRRSNNKIAVIFASGDIVQGKGEDNLIGADDLSRTIRNARLDESIKAIVLRVNSPGGDGVASDIILREVKLAKMEKPVVVSMGNLAASGGYYIACHADKIIANPTTITGSIGVFGLVPNFQGFFSNKLGITFDGVNTNQNADFVRVTKSLPEYQRMIIQKEIDRFYDTFINHVATGRGMTLEEVDDIAQGRVWSGSDAYEIGLVDALGGLEYAIAEAAKLADLEDYRSIDLPVKKEPIEVIMQDLFGEMETRIVKRELGNNYKYYKYIKEVQDYSGIQARMPYTIDIR